MNKKFFEDLDRSIRDTAQLTVYFSRQNLGVFIPGTARYAGDGNYIDYVDRGDFAVRYEGDWIWFDAKQKSVPFYSRASFPYPDLILFPTRRWDDAPEDRRPDIIMMAGKNNAGFLILPTRETEHLWQVRDVGNRDKRTITSYVVSKRHTRYYSFKRNDARHLLWRYEQARKARLDRAA